MSPNPSWFYNEFLLSGTDFHSEKEARSYQQRVKIIRDSPGEAAKVAEKIGLLPGHGLLDIGTGPGLISVELAKLCGHVTATDISDMMMQLAREYADAEGVKNIDFLKGGFLDPDTLGKKFDRVICQRSFHHIPDFWKQIALLKINRILNTGGIFYIDDVIFSFPPRKFIPKIEGWYEDVKKLFGGDQLYTAENHISKEYSTFTWVMEGMIEEAGFAIERKTKVDDFFTNYVCRKSKEA